MSGPPVACPNCGKADIRFREERHDWVCEDCLHRWEAATPSSGSTGDKAQEPQPEKVKLFLSYGRKDATELADRLCVDLAAAGYDIWRDTREITTGTDWQQEIVDGLRSAQLVVALMTPHSVRSSKTSSNGVDSVCLGEIAYALYNPPSTPVVPVMGQQCDPPLCIFHLDFADMSAWQDSEDQYQAGLQRLIDGIGAALRGEKRYRKWYHQLQPWDFAPFLYEKRQGFVGREWLFDEIDAWRTTHNEPALLITGDPGTGKSAIVAELVHHNPHGQVIAYHCCQADTRKTLEPGQFVRSIAAMIASKLPEYAEQLDNTEIQEFLSEESCHQDPGSALERGILTPLQAVPAPEEGVRYILIDALDEAITLRKMPGQAAQTIVHLLATRMNRLPVWLRVVATTRNEPDVLEHLSTLRARELDAEDARNFRDIERFIMRRLQTANLAAMVSTSRLSPQVVTDALLRASEGNFLYVRQALDAIEREQYHLTRLDQLPAGLSGFYRQFFERSFPDNTAFQSVERLLEVIAAAGEPLSSSQLVWAAGLNSERILTGILRKLGVYLRVRTDDDGLATYAVYHKSLADWLTDPRRAGAAYSIDPVAGHQRLADTCWAEYEQDPKSMSHYALTCLIDHLAEISSWERIDVVMTDLQFVEAKCAAGKVFDLVQDYSLVLDALPELQEERERRKQRRERLRQYGDDLVELRQAMEWEQPKQLPVPPDSLEVQQGMHRAEVASLRSDAGRDADSRAEQLQAFATFVSSHSHQLDRHPRETLAVAFNHASGGSVVDQAQEPVRALREPWLERDPRPPAPPTRPICLRVLEGHTSRVCDVAITPDSRTAISAGDDDKVRVWDLDSGKCLRILEGHSNSVRSVALTSDGHTAVSASDDETLRVWNVETGECLRILEGHTDWVSEVAMTPDGHTAVSAGTDNTLRVWNIGTGECLRTLDGHSYWVNGVAFTPDGRTAVSASRDNTLRVWDITTGDCLRTLDGHSCGVLGVALTPDSHTAVSASADGTLRVWDVASGECLRILEGHSNWVSDVALTPDGHTAISASNDKTLRVWNVESGECLRILEGHSMWVRSVALAADGHTAVSASDDATIRVWDVVSGEYSRSLGRHYSQVNSLALIPRSQTVVSASADQTLRVWDTASGECLQILQGHSNWVNGVAITPNGRIAVSASRDNTLRVWCISSGECLWTLDGHSTRVRDVALTPDGRTAVSASADMTLRVWDIDSGECLRILKGHSNWVNGVALTPDGRTVVSASRDSTLRAWDLDGGECLRILEGHSDRANGVVLTSDGRTAISASEDGTLRVWDVARGECLQILNGHFGPVNDVALTPDAHLAISASSDCTMGVWDIGSGKLVAVYPLEAAGHSVTAVTENSFVVGTGNGQLHFLTLQNWPR